MGEFSLSLIFVAGLMTGVVVEQLTPATTLKAALVYAAMRAVIAWLNGRRR